MKVIMPEQAHEKIKSSNSKFFTVVFRRENDKVAKDPNTGERIVVARAGDLREMNCKTGVKVHRKTPNGEGRKYSFSAHDLISAYDMVAKGYRSFKWANILTLKIGGEEYVVLSPQTLEYCQENPDTIMARKVEESGIEV